MRAIFKGKLPSLEMKKRTLRLILRKPNSMRPQFRWRKSLKIALLSQGFKAGNLLPERFTFRLRYSYGVVTLKARFVQKKKITKCRSRYSLI